MSEIDPNARPAGFSEYSLWGMLCAAFIAAFYPVWKNLISAWTLNDNYSHGFAIVPLTLFLLWRRHGELKQAAGRGPSMAAFAVIASLAIYVFALTAEIQTLSSLSMIPFLAATALYLWGYRLLKLTLFPLALLSLMIPVPAQVIAAMTIPLQLLVTKIAGILGTAIGIPVYIQGNLIQLPNHIFEVVEACSGLRSIMTLVTIGAFLSYLTLDKIWKRTILIASALPIAIVVNALRVLAMMYFAYYFEIDLLKGKVHTLFGMGIFIAALFLFMAVQKMLEQWRIRPIN